jgi:hypothetical protein
VKTIVTQAIQTNTPKPVAAAQPAPQAIAPQPAITKLEASQFKDFYASLGGVK